MSLVKISVLPGLKKFAISVLAVIGALSIFSGCRIQGDPGYEVIDGPSHHVKLGHTELELPAGSQFSIFWADQQKYRTITIGRNMRPIATQAAIGTVELKFDSAAVSVHGHPVLMFVANTSGDNQGQSAVCRLVAYQRSNDLSADPKTNILWFDANQELRRLFVVDAWSRVGLDYNYAKITGLPLIIYERTNQAIPAWATDAPRYEYRGYQPIGPGAYLHYVFSERDVAGGNIADMTTALGELIKRSVPSGSLPYCP